jgi:tetratricopeptide (TPR) repeat protein
MKPCWCWVMALVAVLLLPGVAVTADAAKEACEKGVSCLDKQDYDGALTALTEAIRLNPKYALAYSSRALVYRKKGDYEKAIADLTKAIRLDPKYAKTYYKRADAYYKKGDYDKAIADLTEAIRLDPKYAKAYYGRALVYRKKGDYDTAILDCTEALRFTSDYAEAYCCRGLAYGRKGDFDKAIADLTEAIRLKPDYADAYYYLGFVYWRKGDHDKAIGDYTEAIRLDPTDANPHNGLAWLLATCPEERFRDGRRAVQHATRACELMQWKDGGCLDTLSAAYAEAGKFDKAVEFQRKALEMATKDADKNDLRKRLELYRDGKPYREAKGK